MLRVTVLADNRCQTPGLACEHGLSLYLEADGRRFLFDTGASDLFLRNAAVLGIRPELADRVILSHGDFDHTSGLRYLPGRPALLLHPACGTYRTSARRGIYGGMDLSEQELQEHFRPDYQKGPLWLSDSVLFLGEIERTLPFEGKSFPMLDREGRVYPCPEDTGLAIRTGAGLVVISGCAHSGICNTVEYAKKLTGETRVAAVMGGFHLLTVDEAARETLRYMRENADRVILGHCTEDPVFRLFEEELPGRAEVLSVGRVFCFD